MDEVDLMYPAEDERSRRSSTAERDPRKRKRSDGESSPPQAPKARSSTKHGMDNWAQRAEAFIHKVNDPAVTTPPGGAVNPPPVVNSYPPPPYNYSGYAYPPPTTYPTLNVQAQQPLQSFRREDHYGSRKREESPTAGKRNSKKKSSRRDESSSSSSSSDSDDDKQKRKKLGITSEQRDKLKNQKEQYEKAQEKLEAQLLKLKEQREVLKEGGAKHEDKIMKDNARLQKEVKNRIAHMKEVLEKIIVGLDQPIIDSPCRRRAESKRESRRSKSRHKSTSREQSEEKEKSKKKKKKRSKAKSSSDEEDEEEEEEEDSEKEKKKKKKKKKEKYKSSSSSEDSDSEQEYKKTNKKREKKLPQMDESVFRMVADLRSSKSSKKGDEMFMDLLGKMSEAYMKAKQENNELTHRINALESENQVLKKQIEDIKKTSTDAATPPPPKWSVKTSHVIEVVEPKRKKKEEVLSELQQTIKDKVKNAPTEDMSRSIRAKMIEKEKSYKNDDAKNGKHNESKERSPVKERRRRSRSKDSYRRRELSQEKRDRYYYEEDDRRRRREYRRSRSKDRRYSRSRSKDRRYSRSRSKDRRSSSRESRAKSKDRREKSVSLESKKYKDRNDKIDLDEWSDKPMGEKDPSLLNLKEKMKMKEKEFEQQKQQWSAITESKPLETSELPKVDVDPPNQPPLPPRPQVAIQWGQGVKRGTPEPNPQAKKTQPIVGKMPWLQKGGKKPGESRFGPPLGVNSNIPPPTVLSSVPTPYGIQTPISEEVQVQPPSFVPALIKKNPPKNPTPQAMNMEAMLAAAQAHMRARSEEFVQPEIEIPLPPLPAASDKDPCALIDTRPPKEPTPPPVREKTELEIMIEKHCPQGGETELEAPPTAAPLPCEPAPKEDTNMNTKVDLPPGEEDMDPNELAMLGIDPADFAGFGK